MRLVSLSVVFLAVAACSGSSCGAHGQSKLVGAPGAETEALRQGKLVMFQGSCDASTAVGVTPTTLAVADDEQNIIRLYDARLGGAALGAVDLTQRLAFVRENGKAGGEADLEGATRMGELAFWVSSHGRNAAGKERPERRAFFATRASPELQPVGTVYRGLVEALASDPRYAQFGLLDAAKLAPKAPGGLNIEGLTVRHEGGLWIGFRSPRPGEKALLASLLNPEQVVEGAAPQFGDFALLELGGRGIRAMTQLGTGYLLVAGSHAEEAASKLYLWDGKGEPRPLAPDVSWLQPEALFVTPSGDEVLVVSDDGTRKIDGVPCKELDDPRKKQFRGLWVPLNQAPK